MDFLTSYRHRLQRKMSRGLLAFGFSVDPLRLVLDLRTNKSTHPSLYGQIVEYLRVHPACDVVVLVDRTTDPSSLLPIVRFVHRLDCDIIVRAYDCIIDVPKEQVYKYIYCMTRLETVPLTEDRYAYSRFSVEVEYNKNTASRLEEITGYWSGVSELKLVLPEYSESLPHHDNGLANWGSQAKQKKAKSFVQELGLMRSEKESKQPGYRSKNSCTIDSLQIFIGTKQSCPHKPKGAEHKEHISLCTRLCVSPMQRIPKKREILDSSLRRKRKIQ